MWWRRRLRFELRQSARNHGFGVERRESHGDLFGASAVTSASPLLVDRMQICARIDDQLQRRRDIRRLQQHLFVVRVNFQNFLVDGAGLRQKTVLAQAAGNAPVLDDRLVGLPGSQIEIAQEIRRVPITRLVVNDAAVGRDRLRQFALDRKSTRLNSSH